MTFRKCNTQTKFINFERHIVFTWQNWATLPFFPFSLNHLSTMVRVSDRPYLNNNIKNIWTTTYRPTVTFGYWLSIHAFSRVFQPHSFDPAFSSLVFSNVAFSTVPPLKVSRFQLPPYIPWYEILEKHWLQPAACASCQVLCPSCYFCYLWRSLMTSRNTVV